MKQEIIETSGNAIEESKQLTVDLVTRWKCFIDASPKTVRTYTTAVKQFFEYIQARQIRRPQREDIIEYREFLKIDHKPTTVQTYIESLKIFFQWTELERIYPNIAQHVKGAKIDNEHKKDYLTSKQVKTLLRSIDRTTVKGKRDYALLSLMVTTGLRTISIVRADVGDLRTAGDNAALYYQGKGHEEKSTYVKLDENVEAAIRDYLKARGPAAAEEPLFASTSNNNTGGRMTTRSISRDVKEHLAAIGLNSDRLTAHSLRHTAATLNLLNGGTVVETQQLLGHRNINTTLIYSHALERANNNSEIRIARAIFG